MNFQQETSQIKRMLEEVLTLLRRPERIACNLQEACHALNISEPMLKKLIRAGEIKARKTSAKKAGKWLVHIESLHAYVLGEKINLANEEASDEPE